MGERGGKEPSKEKWPERWVGARESRGKGVLRKRVWPAVHNVAEGGSQVSTQGLVGAILGGVQAGVVALPFALG